MEQEEIGDGRPGGIFRVNRMEAIVTGCGEHDESNGGKQRQQVERINLRDATEKKAAKPAARDGSGHLRTVNKGKNHPAEDEEDINTPCAVGRDGTEVEPGAGVTDLQVKERDPKRGESSDSGKRINAFQQFSSVWRDDKDGCGSNRCSV